MSITQSLILQIADLIDCFYRYIFIISRIRRLLLFYYSVISKNKLTPVGGELERTEK